VKGCKSLSLIKITNIIIQYSYCEDEMKLTGERVIPNLMADTNGLLREHIRRYEFAAKFATGRVLDIACGVGYGTQILLDNDSMEKIQHIVGVDIDKETIDYAKVNYSREKVSFLAHDAASEDLEAQLGILYTPVYFDTIVCLETIEHLERDIEFINNIYPLWQRTWNTMLKPPPYTPI
jgi:2-polyprenyl-3-methyl-5-hydroxy-6-metoxy-1,4-benzoquinol methylase